MLGYSIGQLREPRFVLLPLQQINTVVIRTWRERLLTWPWRPWVRTTTITIPDPQLIFNKETFTYYGHPDTVKAFRKAWQENGLLRDS